MPNEKIRAEQVYISTGKLVGRTTAGTGAGEEIPLDSDGTLTANSDTRVATQKAVKTYSDTKVPYSSASSDVDLNAKNLKNFFISKTADATAKLAIDVGSISTATTRTLTMPDASVNLTPASGSFAASGAVTSNGNTMSTAKMLGRSTAATGAIEEITVGTGLTLSSGTLSASGGFLELAIADYQGPSVVGLLGRYTATRTGTLGSIRLVSDSLPVGSNCIAELRKNSTTSGNVLSATLQITTTESATNGQYIGTTVNTFSSTAIAAGDVFYVYLTGVGSTTPATNVRALLYTT